MPDNPLPTGPLPPVQRLSRAVLLVVAGLVTVTLLAVAFLATPKPIDHPSAASRPIPPPSDPGFLQHPPPAPSPTSPEITEQEYLRRLWAGMPPGQRAGAAPPPPGTGLPPFPSSARGAGSAAWDAAEASDPASGPLAGPSPAGATPAATPALPTAAAAVTPRDLRREAFVRALRAPLTPPGPAPTPSPPTAWPPLPDSDPLADPAPAAARARLDQLQTVQSALTATSRRDPALLKKTETEPPNASLVDRDGTRDSSAILAPSFAAAPALAQRHHPTATLPAGTIVPALLLTAVVSDLPGTLIAQVSRDVYDLHQRQVVLPRGTRLLGRYDNQVAVGQQRLLVVWTRLQLLDGTLLDLPGLPAADPTGAAGLPAQVDNHILRVFGDAILLSLLGAGADLSQPTSANALAAPSAGSVASAALGLQLSEAGTQLLRRDLAIQPTLTLPAGTPFDVFVNSDLAIPSPNLPSPLLPSTARATTGGQP